MDGSPEILILGGLEVLVGGRPIPVGGGQRSAILVILVLHLGQAVTTDRLIEELWAGRPPSSALNTLHAQVSRLRRALSEAGADPGLVRSSGHGYRLMLDSSQVDAVRFEELIMAGREALARRDWEPAAAAFGRALHLWRGTPLTDFSTAAWAQCEVIRLEELRHAAEESRAEAELAMGRHVELLPRLEHRVAAHPLRERSAAQLMMALYRSGRQSDALAVYERIRQVLAAELGVDPAPSLQRLHISILNHEPALGSDDASARPAGISERISNLPPRNPVFSGRADLLASAQRELASSPGRTVAFFGLSGVGKTQLALEYAHRWADSYQVIWRASGPTQVTLDESLAELAVRLGVPRQADRTEMAGALVSRLATVRRWLLIIEDLDEADGMVEQLLPPADGGHVVITSRNRAWGRLAVPLPVLPFSRQESLAFMARRLTRAYEPAAAAALAEQLGDLPVALEQAAAYVEQTGMGLAEYGVLFQRRARRLLRRSVGADRFTPAWQPAFDLIGATVPAALELLRLCAVLDRKGTSLALLRRGPGSLPPALRAAVLDELELEDAIAQLLRHSLIDRDGDRLSMHPLVQMAARDALFADEPHGRHEWLSRSVAVLALAAPADCDTPASWGRWDEVVPHLIAIIGQIGAADPVPEELPRVLSAAADYLTTRASFDQAGVFLEAALELARRSVGEHPDLALILTERGRLQEVVGHVAEARTTQEEALALAEKVYGADHPFVAHVLKSLADVLTCLRDLPHAERTLRRALTILESSPDGDRRETAAVLRDLGFVAWAAGDLRSGVSWLTRALTEFRILHGAEHPAVAHALSGLGLIQQDAGDLAQAARSQLQAASLLTAVYGREHPDVAHTLDKLGYVLRLLGRLAEAEAAHREALTILESCYGAAHGELGMPLTNLGLVHQDRGEAAAAAECQQAAWQAFVTAFGADHPHAHLALRRLGMARLLQGDAEEARRLLERALEGTALALGGAHPDVGRTLLDLARAHEDLHDADAAAACHVRGTEILRAAYGEQALP
ncbi:tetratricopeptide repeat protein [Streptosporangiaceae bacterium NEAU-GS5]|nr:tetratricopeptide repeat protein [Streptosporangiaceae bacterium NEAU-GS5]